MSGISSWTWDSIPAQSHRLGPSGHLVLDRSLILILFIFLFFFLRFVVVVVMKKTRIVNDLQDIHSRRASIRNLVLFCFFLRGAGRGLETIFQKNKIWFWITFGLIQVNAWRCQRDGHSKRRSVGGVHRNPHPWAPVCCWNSDRSNSQGRKSVKLRSHA